MSGPISLNGGPCPDSRDVSASLSGLPWGRGEGDASRQVLGSRHLLLACASRWRLGPRYQGGNAGPGPGLCAPWSAPRRGGQRLALGPQRPWLVPGLAKEQKRGAPSVPFSLVPSPDVVPAISSPRIDSVLENVVSPGTGFVFSAGDSVLCSENQGPRAGPDGGWGWVAPAHVTGSHSLADCPVTRWGTPAAYLRVSPARLSAARNGASAPLQ